MKGSPHNNSNAMRVGRFIVATLCLLLMAVPGGRAQETLDGYNPTGDKVITDFCSPAPFGQIVEGFIDSITIDDPADPFSGGTMVVAGTEVVIPRNLVITLPANWQTLQQLYVNAPPACQATGETGLAIADTCANGGLGGFATILANRVSDFSLIAGEAEISKNPDALTGPVTHIDYTNGYFEVNGVPGLPGSGQMVRLNDPDGVHTIQQGPGCDPTMPNCSADVRYTNDPDNYTATFSTGYPLCIPSTVTDGVNRLTGADASGVGDPFCPQTNRPADPFTEDVADSRFYAPIRLGDTVTAEGNFEDIGGVHFLSAHTIGVNVALTTRPDPDQPDYMIFDEVEWDTPGFQNARARVLLIGFTTLLDSQLDIYSLHKNPNDPNGDDNYVPLASTVGNPTTVCQGVGGAVGVACGLAQGGGIFKINYDVDFIVGVKPSRSPCENLFNAGLRASSLCSLAEEFSVLSPVSREIQALTRHGEELKAAGITNFNIVGAPHTYGQYLNPVGLGHPEFVEINLGLIDFPFLFSGEPWNLDRRLRVGGCEGPCEDPALVPMGSLGLDPYPWEEIDPRLVSNAPVGCTPGVDCQLPTGAEDRMFAYFPFGPTDFVPYPPPASTLPGDVVCDDGNLCTVDGCDPATGCTFTPVDGAACDDGDLCTTADVCAGGICAGTPIAGCTCGQLSITGPTQLPAAGTTFAADVSVDTTAPLGAYTISIAWNAAALQLDSVTGGQTFEFSGLPLCNIDNVAGTATCAATQSLSLTTPTGLVSIATLNFTVLDASSGSETVTVTPQSLFDASPAGGGIPSCTASEALTMDMVCGDVNGDGLLNIADALLVAQYEVGLRQCDDPAISRFDACDINPTAGGDALCNIGDALKLAQCDVGLVPCSFQCTPLTCTPPAPVAGMRFLDGGVPLDHAFTPTTDVPVSLNITPAGPNNPDDLVTAEIIIGAGTTALGAYSMQFNCDPSVMSIEGFIFGGNTLEFSGPPSQNVNAAACTAQISGFQNFSLTTPTGNVSVARVNMRILTGATAGAIANIATVTSSVVDTNGAAGNPVDNGGTVTIAGGGAVCGNGVTEAGEACDDGNTVSGDCCSATCQFETGACTDGDACTTGDVCDGAGTCTPGTPTVCTASDQCHTAGTCDPATGVCSNPNATDGTACDDANACTQNDTCQVGVCTGANPVVCTAADQCHAAGTCDPATGICSNPNATDGTACDDGDACTTGDQCAAGVCAAGTPVVCTALDTCHVAGTCDPATGACSNPNATDGTTCDDGDACTQTDACQAGVCTGTNPVVCTASDQCHVAGTCDPATGVCNNPNATDGTVCDDGNACTTGDVCTAGICAGAVPAACNDGNPCTDDTCDPAGGCINTNNTAPCDDGDACTVGDVCAAGACTAGAPANCDDLNPCTDDQCNPLAGCIHADNTLPCDDGSACTLNDTCGGGVCVPGAAPNCDDGNLCTTDTCDPATGCVNTNNSVPCDDGNVCTVGDVCSGGSCAPGAAANCNDNNVCTTDTCDPASGCINANNTSACDDGDACTTGDVCTGGLCVGAPIDCNDGNLCTTDTCSGGICSNTNNTVPCDDGDPCTTADACSAGACGGVPVNCDDLDPCTLDTCVAGVCQHAPQTCGTTVRVVLPATKPAPDGNVTAEIFIDSAFPVGAYSLMLSCDQTIAEIVAPAQGGNTFEFSGPPSQALTGPCAINLGAFQNFRLDGPTGNVSVARVTFHVLPTTAFGATSLLDVVTSTVSDTNGIDLVFTEQDATLMVLDAGCGDGIVDAAAGEQCDDGNVLDGDCCTSTCQLVVGACDDGNACTAGDACNAQGFCQSGAALNCNDGNVCTTDSCDVATGCVNTNNTLPCNDANVCTQNDTCSAGTCVGGAAVSCNDNNVCTTDSCDAVNGCQNVPTSGPCNDGDACTTADTCSAGQCAGTPLNCNDNNTCTTDSCNSVSGCVNANNTSACDDGNACTTGDVCSAGQCSGTPLDCNDGNVCTNDSCSAGSCINAPNAAPCDDGDLCTTGDVCSAGACTPGAPVNCDDGNACTLDSCSAGICGHTNTCGATVTVAMPAAQPSPGEMVQVQLMIDTQTLALGAYTTTLSCDPAMLEIVMPTLGGDTFEFSGIPNQNLLGPCNLRLSAFQNQSITAPTGESSVAKINVRVLDGVAFGANTQLTLATSTLTDTDGQPIAFTDVSGSLLVAAAGCGDGVLDAAAGEQCDDGNTVDGDCCSATCTFEVGSCDDGDACTVGDACGGGVCVSGGAADCNDGNACTDDSCDSVTGCVNTNNSAACDDGNACTSADVCSAGSCSGSQISCDDGNGCTDDSCNPASGCVNANNSAPCDDGNACTTNDTCSAGSCVGGAAPSCDDGNVCTDDSCNPASGCVNANNSAPCDDGNACTTTDVCSAGSCVGSGGVSCDDGNPCTDDSCDAAGGCQHTNNTAACDDGNACTTNDTCSAGSCVGGAATNCDDGNVCTNDSCSPASGCAHANNSAPCDDGNACTSNDVCSAGSCAGSGGVSCDDGNPCTNDTCDAAGGCQHSNNASPCDDGNACTTNDACSAGSCQGGAPLDCNDGNGCTDDGCNALSGCIHADNSAPCDDGNVCTIGDTCGGGSCQSGSARDCNDGNVCTNDSCNPVTGCGHAPNSAPCDDGNACTAGDVCSAGSCVGGSAPSCDDGNACTTDSCDALSGGCVHDPVVCGSGTCDAATGQCRNDIVCVAVDDPAAVYAGRMTKTAEFAGGTDLDAVKDSMASVLAYANSTINAYNGGSGDHVLLPFDLPAGDPWFAWGRFYYPGTPGSNDANSFMLSVDGGELKKFGNNKGYFQKFHWDGDGNVEVGDLIGLYLGPLSAGQHTIKVGKREVQAEGKQPRLDVLCLTHDGLNGPTDAEVLGLLGEAACTVDGDCDDGNACTTDSCVAGQCRSAAVSCDDGDACTKDTCDTATGACGHAPRVCDDGNACNGVETCDSASGCVAGSTVDCNDGNACTDDVCDPADGTCGHPAVSCDDGNLCTVDTCDVAGGCGHAPIVCGPGQVCSPSTGICEAPTNMVCVAAGSDPTLVVKQRMTVGTQYTGGADLDPNADNLTSPLLFPDTTASSFNGGSGDEASYLVTLPSSGEWYLWGRFYYPGTPGSNDANSMRVRVPSNGTNEKFGNNKGYFQKWHWDGDGTIENGPLEPLALGFLGAGTHEIIVEKREVQPVGKEPRLDVMCFVREAGNMPTDTDVMSLLAP